MKRARTIFAQLLDYVPRREFRRCVARYNGERNVRSFSCWDQFLCMLFAQLTCRESLRDIEICLRGMNEKLYALGLRGKVSRSTLADANDGRSSQIYSDLCKILIRRAQKLYADDVVLSELITFAYALDSSWIRLCVSLCPWARFGSNDERAFVKIHTLLDLKGSIPAFIAVSAANINDFEALDWISIVPGAFYIMDKGYFDLKRLRKLNEARAYFVIRKKKYVNIRTRHFNPVEKGSGVELDRIVKFRGRWGRKNYPDSIRLITFRDEEMERTFLFLTNNFQLPALLICQLYKERWKIELFFRWIKQHLRVTKFYGTSLNAIETQIWIATSAYLLVAIAKKELALDAPLYQLLQLLSVSLFEEKPILQAFSQLEPSNETSQASNQLNLF